MKIYTTKGGFTGNIKQIAEHYNINSSTLSLRLRNGMTIDEAINEPIRETNKVYSTKDGFTGNIKEIAEHYCISKITLYVRLKRGMEINDAIFTPVKQNNKKFILLLMDSQVLFVK